VIRRIYISVIYPLGKPALYSAPVKLSLLIVDIYIYLYIGNNIKELSCRVVIIIIKYNFAKYLYSVSIISDLGITSILGNKV
jgi:hypothetical protein